MSESISGGLAADGFMKVGVGLVAMGSGLEAGGVGRAWQRMALISPKMSVPNWHRSLAVVSARVSVVIRLV